MNVPQGPQRRVTDHVHLEYWTEDDQFRFENVIREELKGIRTEIRELARNVLLMLGALALLGFLIPVLAPFLSRAISQ